MQSFRVLEDNAYSQLHHFLRDHAVDLCVALFQAEHDYCIPGIVRVLVSTDEDRLVAMLTSLARRDLFAAASSSNLDSATNGSTALNAPRLFRNNTPCTRVRYFFFFAAFIIY
jgi:hypothetical protein